MHRYSAKVRSIFSVLASILLLVLLVLLAACSDISGKDSTSGSVSFSFDSNFLRSVNSRAAEYIGEWINKSEDGTEETKEYTVQFEVNILGDYTDSKTVEWKTQNYPNVHPAHQDIHNQETESEKIEYPEQKVTFDNIAVGKTVYAQVNVYVLYSYYTGETQKELIMKGKSVTKTITEGENTLPVSVSSIYKMFPVSINLTFEKDTPSNAGDFDFISVYAFKKDSDILAKICKLCANEDDEAALEAIHYSSGSDGKVEPAFWYAADNVDVSENKAEYADGVFTLTGKMELVRDEELVFVALINYKGGTNGITYLGHVDANASNLEAVKSKAIVPNADGTNVELKLYRMDTVTSLYALYNKTSEPSSPSGYSYNFNFTHESAISIEPSSTEGIETGVGSFAFDADGNYYVLVYNLTNYTYSIKSSKFTEAKTVTEIEGLSGITIDRKKNVLYAWFSNQMTFNVYRFPKFISEGSAEYEIVSFNFEAGLADAETYHDSTILVANGGTLYGWGCSSESTLSSKKLYKLDLEESSLTATRIDFDYEALGLSSTGTITDMFYQDGALYLLESEQDFSTWNSFDIKSRGAVIRYKKGSFDKCGWTDETKATVFTIGSEASESEKFRLYNGSDFIYIGEDLSKPYILPASEFEGNGYPYSGKTFTAYSPSTSSAKSAFYGPQKFIAIKPKKLVIADGGVAFFTDSDVWKYKNINRVVTVDLNNFIIDSVQELDDISFTQKQTSAISLSGSGYGASITADSALGLKAKVYGSGFMNETVSGTIDAGIPCVDTDECE